MRSEIGVPACELNGDSREDDVEVAPVLVVSRTEERSPKLSVRKCPFRDCLCDGSFACSGEPVQPVDRGCNRVLGPMFDLVQNGFSSPVETFLAVAVPKPYA